MDTEALKSLVWLIAGGVVFFLMMRFGCGAHIGGHGRHESGKEKSEADKSAGNAAPAPHEGHHHG